MQRLNQLHEQHREHLARAIAAARQRDGSAAPIWYLGGYCDNSRYAHFGDAEHPDRLIVNAQIGAS